MTDENQNICEEKVYKLLFDQFAEKLFRFLYLKFNNEELARDCMQESFITLWQNCKKVNIKSVKSYIFTVGRNKAIDIIRKEKLHLSIVEDDNRLVSEELAEEDETKSKKMNLIMAKMPNTSKEVFLMNRVGDMTYAEIANQLGISVKAVEKRMSIALKIIREQII